MKKLYCYVLFCALLSLPFIVFAQDLPKVSPPEPDVFSLFKYTDIPVSNNTGIPNISIPVHSISTGNFVLPISLSYHSSGITIDEVASSVGLGWSLNAGGMISQTVIGNPDDQTTRLPLEQYRELEPDVDPQQNINCNSITNEDYHTLRLFVPAISEGGSDISPDVFYFSTGNYNGKFFFDNNNIAHTIPKSDIKIAKVTGGFKITDEKGIKFSYMDISINIHSNLVVHSTSPVPPSTESRTHSYYLTSIEDVNGKKVFFAYVDHSYEYQNQTSFIRKKRQHDGSGVNCDYNPDISYPLSVNQEIKSYAKVLGKSIHKISTNYNNEIVEFSYENCPRLDLPPVTRTPSSQSTSGGFALKKIIIKNKETIVDTHTLNYDYFNLNNYVPCVTQTSEANKNLYRLKLKGLSKNGVEDHAFEYYENGVLPNRLSNNFDSWNRFKNYVGGIYTFDQIFDVTGGADRNPDLESSKLGVLKKIVYPTKGSSSFSYGLNKVYRAESPSPTFKRAELYIYTSDELTGEINYDPQYLSETFTINNREGYVTYKCKVSTGEQTTTNWVNISLFDHQTNSYVQLPGCNNGSQTFWTLGNGTYTLYLSGVLDGAHAGFYWYEKGTSSSQYSNVDVGGLRIEKIEHKDRDTTVPVNVFYEYNSGGHPDSFASSGIVSNNPQYSFVEDNRITCCGLGRAWVYHANFHVQQNKTLFPMNNLNGYHIMYKDVQVFDEPLKSNGYTNYKYNYSPDDRTYKFSWPPNPVTSLDFLRGDLIEEIQYNFKNNMFNKIKERRLFYFDNYKNKFFDANPGYDFVIGLNLTVLLNEFSCTDGTMQCTRVPSHYLLGYYKLHSIKKYVSKIEEKVWDENGENPIEISTNYFHEGVDHMQLTRTEKYTSDGNKIVSKISYPDDVDDNSSLGNDVLTSPELNAIKKMQQATTGNPTGLHQVATVVQAETTVKNSNEDILSHSVQRTNYSEPYLGLILPKDIQVLKGTYKSNAPNKNILDDRIIYHSYYPNGNVKEVSVADGTKAFYIWGYNKQYPIAKLENFETSQITGSISSLIANVVSASDLDNDRTIGSSGSEGSLRSALSALRNEMPEALVTTYTYDPLIGVTSMTDARGKTVYYGYDGFNRLEHVKDGDGKILSHNEYHYKDQP